MTNEQALAFIKIIETALGRDKTITELAEDEDLRKIMAEIHGDGRIMAMDGLILDVLRNLVSRGAQAVDGNGDTLSLWSWKGQDGIERTEVARLRQGTDVNFLKIVRQHMGRFDLHEVAIKANVMEMIEENAIFKEHAQKVADTFERMRTAIEERDQLLAREFEGKDLAQIFADEMVKHKAANYIEYGFTSSKGRQITVTTREVGKGLTPGQVVQKTKDAAKRWKALAKRLLKRLNAPTEAQQQDWTLAVTPNDQTSATVPGLTTEQEKAVLMIWPTCGGTFKVGETQIMAYRGTAEQVAGVGEYLFKHGHAVSWEHQT